MSKMSSVCIVHTSVGTKNCAYVSTKRIKIDYFVKRIKRQAFSVIEERSSNPVVVYSENRRAPLRIVSTWNLLLLLGVAGHNF